MVLMWVGCRAPPLQSTISCRCASGFYNDDGECAECAECRGRCIRPPARLPTCPPAHPPAHAAAAAMHCSSCSHLAECEPRAPHRSAISALCGYTTPDAENPRGIYTDASDTQCERCVDGPPAG